MPRSVVHTSFYPCKYQFNVHTIAALNGRYLSTLQILIQEVYSMSTMYEVVVVA